MKVFFDFHKLPLALASDVRLQKIIGFIAGFG
jgi:hypothetical protein